MNTENGVPITTSEQTAEAYLRDYYRSIGDFYDATQSNLPQLLYHYTNLDALFGIVESNCLRCSFWKYQNDRSEIQYGIEVAHEIVDRLTGVAGLVRDLDQMEALKTNLSNLANHLNIYTFSLSIDKDSLSQWRAYAPGRGGVCIGFDRGALSRLTNRYGKLWPAIYDKGKQAQLLETLIRVFIKAAKDSEAETISMPEFRAVLSRFLGALSFILAAAKNPAFEEEHEVRLTRISHT